MAECNCWRSKFAHIPRQEPLPKTLEAAQAMWERDQELIEEMRATISRQAQTINQLRQRKPYHETE